MPAAAGPGVRAQRSPSLCLAVANSLSERRPVWRQAMSCDSCWKKVSECACCSIVGRGHAAAEEAAALGGVSAAAGPGGNEAEGVPLPAKPAMTFAVKVSGGMPWVACQLTSHGGAGAWLLGGRKPWWGRL